MDKSIKSLNGDKKISIAIMSSFVILTMQYLIIISMNLSDTITGSRIQLLSKGIVGLLYLLALPTVIRRNLIKLLISYVIALFVFTINYFFYYENWFYLKDIIFSLFFICLPSFMYAYSINDWSVLKEIMKKTKTIVFMIGIFLASLIFLCKASIGSYSMSLSYYMLLPAIMYLDAFMDELSIKSGIFALISLAMILLIGSRGAIMCIGVFIILKFIKIFKDAGTITKGLYFIIGFVSILFYKDFLKYINTLLQEVGINSRSINLFIGEGVYLSGRDRIYEKILISMKNSLFSGVGLASDRRILEGSNAYVHNIFLEILANYGVIFGVLINIFLLYLLKKNIMTKDEEKNNIILIWICIGFIHLLVSSSYLIDFRFWIYLGLSLKLSKPVVHNLLRRSNKMVKSIKNVLKKNKLITKTYIKVNYKISSIKIKRHGNKILNDLNNALKQTNHVYFLDYGALLGFVREGTFLSHDPDIDISVVYKNKKTYNDIEESLTKAGFRKKFCKLKKDKIILEAYVKYGTKIDVFYYYNKEDKSYAYSTYQFKDRQYTEPYDRSVFKYEYSLINETILTKWEDISFPIPKNHIQTLTEKYGENWDIPIKTWSIDNYKETVHQVTDDGITIYYF